MSKRMGGRAWAAVLPLLLAVGLPAPAFALTPAEDAAIARAEARGRLIYTYDQAAWVSTDEVLKRVPPGDLPKTGGGWLVEPRGDLLRVTFYSLDGGAPTAFAWADVRGRELVTAHVLGAGEDRAVTPMEARMIAARTVAAQQGKGPCTTAPFNTVVLPPAAGDGAEAAAVSVYLLSAQVKTGVYPFGGHYEIDVGPDGQVVSSREFTKSCLNIDEAEVSKGARRTVALYITHLLDPVPTEIHVYMSLWVGRPVYVGTGPDRIWVVENGRVRAAKGS